MLEDTNLDPPKSITFPSKYKPAVVDRYVNHVYFGSYSLDEGGGITELQHATKKGCQDEGAYALTGMHDVEVHLQLYSLAEWTQDSGLRESAYARLVNALMKKNPIDTKVLFQVLESVYAEGEDAVVKDEDGLIRRLLCCTASLYSTRRMWDNHVVMAWVDSGVCPQFGEDRAEVCVSDSNAKE